MDAKHSLLSQNDDSDDEEILHDVTVDSLKFQDTPVTSKTAASMNLPLTGASSKKTIKTPDKSGSFTSFPAHEDDADVNTDLLEGEKKQAPFWTFEYYQTWFDVDTDQVGQRILGSMIPKPGKNYLRLHIRPNPDLYGPFWICTTLVFTTAICGNLASYISCGRNDYKWTYDFHKVTFAAAAIFSYWWLIPTGLFGLLTWRKSQCGYSYMEIICVYGYSLAIYIPISILWVIPFSWLQWTLVLIGTVLSGSVLLFTFWPALREDEKKVAVSIMAVVLIFHAALAVGFVLYFFHVPSSSCPPTTVPVPIPTPKPTLPPVSAPLTPKSAANNIKNNLVSGKTGGLTGLNSDTNKPISALDNQAAPADVIPKNLNMNVKKRTLNLLKQKLYAEPAI